MIREGFGYRSERVLGNGVRGLGGVFRSWFRVFVFFYIWVGVVRERGIFEVCLLEGFFLR